MWSICFLGVYPFVCHRFWWCTVGSVMMTSHFGYEYLLWRWLGDTSYLYTTTSKYRSVCRTIHVIIHEVSLDLYGRVLRWLWWGSLSSCTRVWLLHPWLVASWRHVRAPCAYARCSRCLHTLVGPGSCDLYWHVCAVCYCARCGGWCVVVTLVVVVTVNVCSFILFSGFIHFYVFWLITPSSP